MTKATWFGTEVVANYGDVEAECRALRESAGVVDLSWRGKIRFTGPDRHKWLQGQVTNDVLALVPGSGHETCVLEVKGHILAHLRLYNPGEYLIADVNPDICASMIQRLDFYRIMEKVEIENVTAEFGLIGLFGPHARDLASPLIAEAIPQTDNSCVETEVNGQRCIIVKSGIAEGYEIYAPPTIAGGLLERLHQRGVRPVGIEALNIVRVEKGIPWQPFELNERIFPQEAGLEERAVSFTKGCYVGQETVARIQSRGHVNRRLVQLSFEGAFTPECDAKLLAPDDGKEIGWVTSAVDSPARGPIGMGYVRREFLEPGTRLVTRGRAGEGTATIRAT